MTQNDFYYRTLFSNMQAPYKPNIWETFPVLETSRLRLREMIPNQDEVELVKFWGDPKVCKYTDFYFPTKNQIHRVLETLANRFETKQGIRWGITRKPDDTIIGTIGFNTWETQRTWTAEIGYDLHPKSWREGLMYEAIQGVLQYGFSHMKIHRIEAQTDPNNMASRGLLEKAGFTYEGTLRDNAFYKDEFHTSCLYSILALDL